MPWKNRHIGNPILTGILNLFYHSGIDDAHCGLRAITKEAFVDLGLSGPGMEFASEMIVKASLKKIRIDQKRQPLSRSIYVNGRRICGLGAMDGAISAICSC